MRPSIARRMWTQPDLPMAFSFRRMSFALFRTNGDVGRIMAVRTPDREMLGMGQRIQDQLALCPDALAYMTRPYGGEAPLFVLTRTGIGVLSSRYRLAAGLGLAVFCTLLGHSVFSWGLKYEKASYISTVKFLEPVFASVWGILFLREVPSLATVLGGAVILGGVVMYSLSDTRQARIGQS